MPKMDITGFITLAIIGIAAGFLSGFMGVGGGIIIVPSLMFFMGLSQHQAQGTSIAAIMLLPVGLLSVMNYYKQGNTNLTYAAVVALFFIAGSYFSSRWVQGVDTQILKKAFAAVMFLVALKMWFGK
jgi:uncharacterized membrane protein YfcA